MSEEILRLNELLGRVQQRRHSVTSQPLFPEPSRPPGPESFKRKRSDSYSSIAEAIAAQEDSISEFTEITEDLPVPEPIDRGEITADIPILSRVAAERTTDDFLIGPPMGSEAITEDELVAPPPQDDFAPMSNDATAVRAIPHMAALSSSLHETIEAASVLPPSVPIATSVGQGAEVSLTTFGGLIQRALSLTPKG
ncbi:MAG: hypothetical protein IPJ88_05655 [Myxococcales bacterium]|nr:MAG: hypothetical protein IPJ88_05655 [Myxococcales bacterium]